MQALDLSFDEVISTTRAVRRRLDLTRPVDRGLIEECLRLAFQAPTARNRQHWHFVVVTDPATRVALAACHRRAGAAATPAPITDDDIRRMHHRPGGYQPIADSAYYLSQHLHEVPVLVVPCIEGRVEGLSAEKQAQMWGSILPAVWSFMLAARSRGLGSVWTTVHLALEHEAAEILGIPYHRVTQAALIPIAHTIGARFRPASRIPPAESMHWDRW